MTVKSTGTRAVRPDDGMPERRPAATPGHTAEPA